MANGRQSISRTGYVDNPFVFGTQIQASQLNSGNAPGAPGNPTLGPSFDPVAAGQDIGQYYNVALDQYPGFEAIQRNISGELSPEVARTIKQAAAERGVATGSYGGGADTTAMLRALGLTSQALTDKGIGQATEAYRSVPNLPPTSTFVSPAQQAQLGLQQQLQNQRLAFESGESAKNRKLQETLARWGAESRQFQTGMQIQASNARAAADRAAAEQLNTQILNQQAATTNAIQAQSGYNPLIGYGTQPEPLAGVQTYDPYLDSYV